MSDRAIEYFAGEEEESLIPYGPDFTPETLGKTLGKDRVLPWLLERSQEAGSRSRLQDAIATTGLAHIADPKNRRDMASHVVQALGNYGLIDVAEDDSVVLTQVGREVLSASDADRDAVFARHILANSGGMYLMEAIQGYELRNEKPTMEGLNVELGQHPTSKNISTLRAWLSRAGILSASGPYAVDDARLAALIGPGAKQLLGLARPQVEFLLAARVHTLQTGENTFEAADIKRLAEARAPDVRIPSKALGNFVRRLEDAGLLEAAERLKGRGGTRMGARLSLQAVHLTDDQIRSFLEQSRAGFYLSELRPLSTVLQELSEGTAERRGRFGEMLAVHICLMLGLRVVGWRERLPVEIDLSAERTVAMCYQRWHIQVKNVEGDLDSDRVDREIGAAAGTGATHIMFVCPRGRMTDAAIAETRAKSRLTPLHIFHLLENAIGAAAPAPMLKSLEAQILLLARLKRGEAERREALGA